MKVTSAEDLLKEYAEGVRRFREAELAGVDLKGADLSGADFSWIDQEFFRANYKPGSIPKIPNLSGANLSGAILSDVNLGNADLRGADLSGAALDGTNLRGVNLSEANLRGAILVNADLTSVVLTRADLREVTLVGSNIKTDLAGAIGLAEVLHVGESHVATRTLHLTAQELGKNPGSQGAVEAFFRGSGLTDGDIAYFRSLIGKPIEYYSCFISYSREDKAFARRLHDQLQGKGIRCWLDEHQLLPGDDLHDRIDQGIRLWDKVLLCCSKPALKESWWVDKEITTAFEKEQRLMRAQSTKVLALIPLDLDGYLFQDGVRGKAAEIRGRVTADFTGWEQDNDKFETAIGRVVKALRADDDAREAPPKPKLVVPA